VHLISNVEVELFVVATARADVATVERPVKGLNVRAVLAKRLVQFVLTLLAHGVNVQDVIVGGSCEELLAWRVADNFAPLLRVFQRNDLLVEIVEVSDRDLAHVARDSNVFVGRRVGDSTSLLVGWVNAHTAGSDCLDFRSVLWLVVRHFAGSLDLLLATVVKHNLVVVSASEYLAAFDWLKTPNFTFEVRMHDEVLSGIVSLENTLDFTN